MNNNILNRFSVNPVSVDIPRSKFDMDHSVKFSGNVGDVIPFAWFDVLPGDTFSVDTAKVIRLQPLVAPIMDNVYLDTYWFFVPYRLVWNHFVEFMGENTSTAWTPQVSYSIPKIVIPTGGFNVGTVADYLGVPPYVGAGRSISALPFRVYASICNEWFRDQNLMNPVHVTVGDASVTGSNGSDQVTDVEKGGAPFIACKYFDQFTAALPSPQKGPAATFSLAGAAPILAGVDHLSDTSKGYPDTHKSVPVKVDYMNSSDVWKPIHNYSANSLSIVAGGGQLDFATIGTSVGDLHANPGIMFSNLYADLSSITQFNVNELRMAFAVQKYYEALARGGSRYIEQVREFFGVTSSDYRFMRPEYLGGNRVPVNVTQVEQTSATDSEPTPIGSVAGMSVTGDSNSDFTKSFTEHGLIMGVCVMRYDHTYQQGMPKEFLYDDLFDLYNPKFANIGEQPVYLDEIYYGATDNTTVFGYNEAWYQYRFKPNRIAGEMRSAYATPLDMWHLADYYSQAPSLSAAWIREDKSNLDRALAVTSSVSNQFVADFYVSAAAARPMPMYSIPGLIDHH